MPGFINSHTSMPAGQSRALVCPELGVTPGIRPYARCQRRPHGLSIFIEGSGGDKQEEKRREAENEKEERRREAEEKKRKQELLKRWLSQDARDEKLEAIEKKRKKHGEDLDRWSTTLLQAGGGKKRKLADVRKALEAILREYKTIHECE